MALGFVTLDVFTGSRYVGNPVAIIHVPKSTPLSQEQKQLIAREFNLSESVFLHERSESEIRSGDVRADIFTVKAEVPFAGHPTIGTSNYLLRYMNNDPDFQSAKTLQLKAGHFPIALTDDGQGVQVSLAHNVRIHKRPFKGATSAQYPVVSIVKGMTFILAKQPSLADLATHTGGLLAPEDIYRSHEGLDPSWQEGLVATYYYHSVEDDAESSSGVRVIRSRMFGSREDPATGSAASALCSYLSLSEDGPLLRKYHLIQGVEMGRRSDIYINVLLEEDKKAIKEVILSGTAVKVMEGKLEIPRL